MDLNPEARACPPRVSWSVLVIMIAAIASVDARAQSDAPPAKRASKTSTKTLRGPFRAWLTSPGGPLPFGLEFRIERGTLRAAIRNGQERIEVPRVQLDGDRLTLGIDHYDSEITAQLGADGKRLTGTWHKRRGKRGDVRMEFGATAGRARRFSKQDGGAAADFGGRWRVQFEKDKNPSVGVFQHGAAGSVTGTFLTTLGDYRFLAGNRDGDRLALSCFDGAHAFLFRARRAADGSLRGDFWSSSTWHETWTAVLDPSASLPDAWALTKADPSHLGRLRFPDLDGRLRSLDEKALRGRACLLVAFGSWCPNCKDETAYLAELHRKYSPRGLSVVGLAFEHERKPAETVALLRRYAKTQGITFPILRAGLSDKKKASQALPILDRVRAYPTTIFLRGDGTVRAVHTGFSGPGTGAEHRKLRERFEGLIEELLKSP